MPRIHVDTAAMRWKATLLEVFLGSIRRAQGDISEATTMATGYDGQLQGQVMAIAGQDESTVRILANDLEELIFRLRQITDAFEAADSIEGSNPALGREFMRMIDGGLLLSSLPLSYRTGDPFSELERRLWSTRDPDKRALLLADAGNSYLHSFAQSDLFPTGGTEADYWKAFQVFLYLNGAIEARPALATWQTAARSSGMELDTFVATATGVREVHVEAWMRAAETHALGLDTAIGEIVDMAQAGETIEEHFGFSMEGNWTEADKDDIVEAVLMVSHAMASATPEADTAGGVFQSVFDGISFSLDEAGPAATWHCTGGGNEVACAPRARDRISPQTIAHELGHSFNARVVNHLNTGILGLDVSLEMKDGLRDGVSLVSPYGELGHEEIAAEINGEIVHVAGRPPRGGYERTDLGYPSLGPPMQQHSLRWGGGDPSGNTANEDFADTFLGWAYDGFTDDPAGSARYDWMESHMAEWIEQASQPIELAWFGEAAP